MTIETDTPFEIDLTEEQQRSPGINDWIAIQRRAQR